MAKRKLGWVNREVTLTRTQSKIVMDNDEYLEVQTKDCSLEAVLVLDYWVVPQCVRVCLRRKTIAMYS